jgi:GTPase KRas protein
MAQIFITSNAKISVRSNTARSIRVEPNLTTMQCKFLFVGEGGVGKTCLRNRIQFNKFETQIDDAIESRYVKQIEVDEESYAPELYDFDTKLHEELVAGECKHNGYFLVFSIYSLPSFEKIRDEYYHYICRGKDSDVVPMVLIGNKCDLDERRQVARAMGEQFATRHNIPYLETSAKYQINANEALTTLIRELKRINHLSNETTREKEHIEDKSKKNTSKNNCKLS